ncbi:MAG TPA: hypothetical protein PL054_02365 [Clostridia bacterium]|nr:MAG: DNA polymerase III subunit delta [Firmicutes bacterium ADurb.Bin146]HOD92698.1 hypothetical protein [Clostridia bacterium]
MKYEDIKNEISINNFKHIYLLYGDDEYLKDVVFNVLKAMIINHTKMNYEEFKFNDSSKIEDIVNECSTYSFSGNSKFIICKNTGFFDKNEFSERLIKLYDYIYDNVYIFFIEANVNKRLSSYKHYNSSNNAYDISKGNTDDVKKFIFTRFKKEGISITAENLDLFIEYSGLNLSFVALSIEKILLYMADKKEVTSEMIRLLCSGITDVKSYELCNYLCKKKFSKTLDVYYDMISLKYGIPYFLAILFNTFYEMYFIKKNNIRSSQDFKIRKLIENAKGFTLSGLKKIVKDIMEYDHNFKTGKIEQESSMIILFATIVNS